MLAKDCNFGDAMERILRDKIVFSINDDAIQSKLLDEPSLTYKRALELAESAEAAAKGQKEMRTPFQTRKAAPQPVQRVTAKTDVMGKEANDIVCQAGALGYGMSVQGQNLPQLQKERPHS